MVKTYEGTCTLCGAENTEVTIINDFEHVCQTCLDNDYFYCEECDDYWACDAVEEVELEDGRVVCEYCAEDMEEDEE